MNRADFATPIWKRLAVHIDARIDELRRLNDTALDMEKTALIRGEIRGLKKILDLATASSVQGAMAIDDSQE